MSAKSYLKEKRRQKWGGGPFTPLPRDFLQSELLRSLSPYGIKLLMDLLAQYNGCNNGDLCITWSLMVQRGWSGKSILAKAQKELIDSEILILSRQGGRHRANLYALSLYSIDECKGKIEEVQPTKEPIKKWLLANERIKNPAKKEKSAPPEGVD